MIATSFVLYLGLVGIIGWMAWQRTRDMSDYLLGGRRIGPWVAALSAGASDMSGWLLLGLPGLAVSQPAAAAWTAAGLLAGTWCNWRFVARPLRETSAALGALTVPAFFAQRFPSHGRWLRAVTALTIVVFFLLYTSAGLVAGGKLFNTVFDLPYAPAVLLGASIILLYTLFGGFLAVAWTDALQAMMMSAALLAVSVLLWHDGGTPASSAGGSVGPLAALSALAWGLGYFGQPHILARFMALADGARVASARRIGVAWSALGLFTAVAIGVGGAGLAGVTADPERVFIIAVEAELAPWLAGGCLAAILAAVMSTADSQLLVTAAALAEDLLPLAGGAARDEAARLAAGRIAVCVAALIACAIALDPDAGVFDLVARAWAGFGATLGPTLLVALHQRRPSGIGALGGMLAGGLTVLAWPALPQSGYGIYELLPAFAVALGTNLALNRWYRCD